MLKTTPFTDIHIALGAKMHEFAGYNMPIQYGTIAAEHRCVREAVGVFDVSHMGEFWVKGEKAEAFLQRITTNDIRKISAGKAQYTCFPNGKGGIVDDLIIYKYSTTKFFLVVNAANVQKDWDWVCKQNEEGHFDCQIENASDRYAQLAVQGPKATEVLQQLTDANLSAIPYYAFREWSFAGVQPVIISNTGYTGAGGFELYFAPEHGKRIWDAIFKVGEGYGIQPIGLGARDSLRLEKWYCLYGHDIDDTTSPLEAGLGWITKFVDGNDFIDRPLLEQQKAEGVKRKLVHFVMKERGIARNGYEICNAEGQTIGNVTSGIMIPDSTDSIGMGYVLTPYSAFDGIIYIKIRDKLIPAKVVK